MEKIKPVTLCFTGQEYVDRVRKIYAESPTKARVFIMNNNTHVEETVIFKKSQKNFTIITNVIKYGISVTDRLYISRKKTRVVTVSPSKFYVSEKGRIMPLTIQNISYQDSKHLIPAYSWIRMLKECECYISFNSIVRYRLYDKRKLYRHLYKAKLEKAELIASFLKSNFYEVDKKVFFKFSHNWDNLNPSLLKDYYRTTLDTLRLGSQLNRKINLAWSPRRLQEVHDEWAKEVTAILAEVDNRELNIRKQFRMLSETLPGLITTTGRLTAEGFIQKHCVASYAHSVDSGRCAIYHIEGYTAEVVIAGDQVNLCQFKGFANKEAPDELKNKVLAIIHSFNESIKGQHFPPHSIYSYDTPVELEELPF